MTLILGEFLYQPPSALDNCIYAVAVIVSGTNPPPGAGARQWPICDTPAAFDKQRRRLKHLPVRLVECLEAIQPYRAELPAPPRRDIRTITPLKGDQQPARRDRGAQGRVESPASRARNVVARAINKLRLARAVATRYDQRDFAYRSTIAIWLRDPVPT